MTSLSPLHTIGDQISEALLLHRDASRKEAKALSVDMLAKVGSLILPGPMIHIHSNFLVDFANVQ